MIFNVSSKQVEIRAAKRFRLAPSGDLSVPGHILLNWLGVMLCITPPPPIPQPSSWSDYIVTLKDGQDYHVSAFNEHHAASMVVYGKLNGDPLAIDGATGEPLGDVKVHRENIASVFLKPNS
ncbi:hypothetical protein [Pseudomonas sp. NPDC096950]|uniref:hypothetical protein n=1 Tax=Pseudomonas sp. NPDC096950 TaxID=3364485 RepID=UPI00383BD67B